MENLENAESSISGLSFSQKMKELYSEDLSPDHLKDFGESALVASALCAHECQIPKSLFVNILEMAWPTKPSTFSFKNSEKTSPDSFDDCLNQVVKTLSVGNEKRPEILGRITRTINESKEEPLKIVMELTALSLGLLHLLHAQKESVLNSVAAIYRTLESEKIMKGLSAEELFSLRRFAPIGHPWFKTDSSEYALFQKEWDDKIGTRETSQLSKAVGWVPSPQHSALIEKTLAPYQENLSSATRQDNRSDR